MPYPVALLLTLAIEVPIYSAVLLWFRLAGRRKAVLCAVGVNLVTHPIVWQLTAHGGALMLAAAELGAWLVEAALLYAVIRREAALLLALSMAANAASFLVGLLLS